MSSAEGPQEPTQASEPERSSTAAPKKKKKKAKAPAPPPPMTEEEIDSPTKQTLGMLSVIGIMTMFMWIFARGGCNYHPPKETRDPRKVDLVDLARDPKDAALEFELRWSMKSWGGAMELAKGPMLEQVKQQQTTCDANPNCAKRASELRATVQATAQLLERDMMQAVSRVITTGTGGAPEKHIIRVERDGQIWKTVSREVDDGSFKPRPPQQMMLPPGQLLMRQPGMPEPASPTAK
ncbi:MAG TPA: hypothetical protein VHB79_22880 [Polyangiaceae bacterium]|nr:hypothetical protein [Polyangiaceae bacterium]